MGKRKSSTKGKQKAFQAPISVANKKAKGSASSSAQEKEKEMDAKIMKVMLTYHIEQRFDMKVEDVANEIGCHIRTKTFRERWGFLKNTRKLIGPSEKGKGFQLTKAGLDEAATPEYKEMMKELSMTSKTNVEHQERIKKHLKGIKAIAMFDFFLRFGSLTTKELSALVGQNNRSHSFFYSFKELKTRGYVEDDPRGEAKKGKRFRLADKVFLKAKEDRPSEDDIDTKALADEVSKGLAVIESRSAKNKSEKKTTKNIKKENVVKSENEDGTKGLKLEQTEGDPQDPKDPKNMMGKDENEGKRKNSGGIDGTGYEENGEDRAVTTNGARTIVKSNNDKKDSMNKEKVLVAKEKSKVAKEKKNARKDKVVKKQGPKVKKEINCEAKGKIHKVIFVKEKKPERSKTVEKSNVDEKELMNMLGKVLAVTEAPKVAKEKKNARKHKVFKKEGPEVKKEKKCEAKVAIQKHIFVKKEKQESTDESSDDEMDAVRVEKVVYQVPGSSSDGDGDSGCSDVQVVENTLDGKVDFSFYQ